jgi:phage-related protein (TIGR01555 family)
MAGPIRKFADGLVNVLTGRGTSIDRGANNFWYFTKKDPAQILAAYRSNWLIAKIVDLPAKDMVREWRDWKAENADIEKLEAVEKALGLRGKILTALIYGRLGGGAIIMGFGDSDPMQPAPEGRPLSYLHVVSKHQLTIGRQIMDPASPLFMQPENFMLSSVASQVRLHPSRVVVFKGKHVPDLPGATWEDVFWGDSVIDSVDRAVQNAVTTTDGFAALIDEAKIDIYLLSGLVEQLAQDGGDAKVMTRIEAMNTGKSIHRAVILDKDDKWEQRQLSWTGMPDMIRATYSLVAGAADIPATRLFGKAPDGMNATGDSDERNYRAMIATEQGMCLRPALEQIDRHLLATAKVSSPGVSWEFAPLSTLTEKEAADIGKTNAETAKSYADSGLVPIDALSKGVQNKLVEDGTYPGLEQALEESDGDLPDDDDDPSRLTQTTNGGKEADPSSAGGGSGSGAARRAANDAAPRTLYVCRKVVNVAEIKAWAKAQGLPDLQDDLHVTIVYSRQPIDWMKIEGEWNQNENGQIEIQPGGVRIVEPLGDRGAVLLFTSSALSWRHEQIVRAGASHGYPDYQPHISLTGEMVDLPAVEPYRGKIVLGPEVFEELRSEGS